MCHAINPSRGRSIINHFIPRTENMFTALQKKFNLKKDPRRNRPTEKLVDLSRP